MKVTAAGDTLTVDIHGMRERDAKFRLEALIENGSANVKRLVVIHGFNGGQILRTLVRNGLESPKIKEICPGENSGQTIILLHPTGKNRR